MHHSSDLLVSADTIVTLELGKSVSIFLDKLVKIEDDSRKKLQEEQIKSMFTTIIYVCALTGLAISWSKNKKKTKMALKKAWKAFENILPQLLSVLVIIGVMLSILDTESITALLGTNSGVLGVLLAATVGAITLIPGFVAFPLAAALLQSGAGVMQIAAFVSTLMMVGVVTLPMEIKTFGKKVALVRNGAAFVFSLVVALVMGVVL